VDAAVHVVESFLVESVEPGSAFVHDGRGERWGVLGDSPLVAVSGVVGGDGVVGGFERELDDFAGFDAEAGRFEVEEGRTLRVLRSEQLSV
jgi:hypothetical protein